MSYVARVVETPMAVRRYYDIRCDQCGVGLKPLEGAVKVYEDGGWDRIQPDGALRVDLHGYYGGFFDGMDAKAWLCAECAGELLKKFHSLRNAIKESQ